MPINVFGNSSKNSEHKIDTSLFVQKPYLRNSYIERIKKEDFNSKNQFRIKETKDSVSMRDARSKDKVNISFNDSSILKNTKHIDRND